MTEDKRTLKVLQIWGDYPPIFAGGALRFNQLTPEFNKLGAEILVLTPRWKGTMSAEVINGAHVKRLAVGQISHRSIQFIRSSFGLFYQLFINLREFDIIHSGATSVFYLPALIFFRLLGKPIVMDFTILDTDQKSLANEILSRLRNSLVRYVDACVGNSKPMVEQLNAMGVPTEKQRLIPNGVNTDICKPLNDHDRLLLRSELGMKPEHYSLLFVGSFLERKGVDLLIDAMIQINRSLSNVDLFVIGEFQYPDDPDLARYSDLQRQRIQDESLETSVHLIGKVDHSEYIRWLQASDIFVFPSRREGMPRVVLEAMATGLAVICTSMGGIAYDIIEQGKSGLIIDDNDSLALSRQILRLMSDERDRHELGKNARLRVLSKFDDRDAACQYFKLYQEILNQEEK